MTTSDKILKFCAEHIVGYLVLFLLVLFVFAVIMATIDIVKAIKRRRK